MPASRHARSVALALVLAGVASLTSGAPASAEQTEVPSLRTTTSNTYRLDAGRYRTRYFDDPVNFRDVGGAWRRIDSDLVPSARRGYALSTRATPYALDLPRTLGGAPVRFASGADWVTFGLVAGHARIRSGADDAVRYANALPGVDLHYETLSDGLKETLVLRNASAPRLMRFVLRTSLGLEPRIIDGGRVEFVRHDGSVAFNFAPPYLEDAAGVVSTDVSVALNRRLDGWEMSLRPDRRWLGAPGRAWPVRLDPTVRVGTQTVCNYIRQTSGSTASLCGSAGASVDSEGGKITRTLVRFDVRALPFAAVITNATMKMDLSSGDFATISVHRLLKPWTTAASWNSYDGTNWWANPGGDYVTPAAATTSVNGPGTYSWNITPLTQLWVDDAVPNDGVITTRSDSGKTSFSAVYLDVTYVTETLPPTINSVQHTPSLPAGWVDNVSLSAKGTATDVGVGLQRMTLTEPRPTPFQQHKYFCAITQPATCEATDATKCGGAWASRCPLTGSKTFSYTTGPFAEGIVKPNLTARDAANNTSAPSEWSLKVDHTAPTLDTPTGNLWDRRNQAADHRFEGLYDPSYSVSVTARDGSQAAPRSGVKKIRFEVRNSAGAVLQSQERLATCDANNGCGFDFPTSPPFTFNTDSVADGDYTMRLQAFDQLDHPSIPTTWTVTVDRKGDIYFAGEWDADPAAGGVQEATERAQLSTGNARRNDATVSTRRVIQCTWDTSQTCGEVRLRGSTITDGDEVVPQGLHIIRGTSANDSRLDSVAEIMRPRRTTLGSPTVSGPIINELRGWQTAPPAHNGTYERYDTTETAEVDEQVVQVRRRLWVDAANHLPFHELEQIGSEVISETFWSYNRQRLETSEVPSDEFAAQLSDANGVVTVEDYHTNPPGSGPPPEPEQSMTTSEAQAWRARHGFNTDPTYVAQTLVDPALTASISRYGLPLTTVELNEMTNRKLASDALDVVDNFGATQAAGAYAGVWLDQAAGGLVRVGFLNNADTRLAQLAQVYPYPSRLRAFTADLTQTQLEALADQVSADIPLLRSLGVDPTLVAPDIEKNLVEVAVATPTVAQQQTLTSRYGANVQLVQGDSFQFVDSDDRITWPAPPLLGGVQMYRAGRGNCSTGFSMKKPEGGGSPPQWRILTAGHCGPRGQAEIWYHRVQGVPDAFAFGPVNASEVSNKDANKQPCSSGNTCRGMDAAQLVVPKSVTSPLVLIRPNQSRNVYRRMKRQQTLDKVHKGDDVCGVGYKEGPLRCGEIVKATATVPTPRGDLKRMSVMTQPANPIQHGDSGGSVFAGSLAYGVISAATDKIVAYTPISTVTQRYGTFVVGTPTN